MRTEGDEIHEETDAARAGSTPNVVRWVLAISLLAAMVLTSIIWITGAVTTDGADDTNNATDRIRETTDRGDDGTDSIVSDNPEFQMEPGGSEAVENPMNMPVPDASETAAAAPAAE